MRTFYYILLFVFAFTVSRAGEITFQDIQITPTNTQAAFSVKVFDIHDAKTFIVTADLKNRDQAQLEYGALKICDGPKLISSCVVEHGYAINGRVAFGFTVATNYYDSSKFSLSYSTNSNHSTIYWFYLKDFCQAK